MSIRLLATDLDGTLMRNDKSISARSVLAMQMAQVAGVRIVWATARGRGTVQTIARDAQFGGFAICGNGAVVIDLADDAKVIHQTSISTETAATVMDLIRSLAPGTVFAMVGTHEFLMEPGYKALSTFEDHWLDPNEIPTADVLTALEAGTIKIVARHPELRTADLYRILAGAAREHVEITHSLAPFVEMAALGVTKASTLASLCADWGIDRNEVAAVGDALNDLPMLEWAGLPLAPANAEEDVRAAASQILPSNEEDGVAFFLESLVNLQ
jgi:Cof subfamily protein (haloacid dehalogenase superfamily)